jgi:hypothetical protein
MVFAAVGATQKDHSDIVPLRHEDGGLKGVEQI